MSLCVSAINFQLFKVIMLENCVLTILDLNWNQRLGHKKTKLNICHHMLTSSTQLQNRSFHVVERTRTSSKCQKMKYARAKRAKILFFIVKYANLSGFCCRHRRGCLSSLLSAFPALFSFETCCAPLKMFDNLYRILIEQNRNCGIAQISGMDLTSKIYICYAPKKGSCELAQ